MERLSYVISSKNEKCILVTGSIFDPALRYNGVALFIPCGLTCFRIDALDFVEKNSNKVKVFINRNPNHKLYSTFEVSDMVYTALEDLTQKGATEIAMNAIRTDAGAGASEYAVYSAVLSWLSNGGADKVERIYLVDKRGGFEKLSL